MDDFFLHTVYEIIAREPQAPVLLPEVASTMGIEASEAEEIAKRLQAARLIYRFPERRRGAGSELVISIEGASRVTSLRREARLRAAAASRWGSATEAGERADTGEVRVR